MPTAYADANMIPSLRSHVTAYSQHRPWALVIRWAKWSNCSSHHCSCLPAWLMWMTDFSLHTANAGCRPSYYSLLMAIVCLHYPHSAWILTWSLTLIQPEVKVSGKFSQWFLSQANANIYARALHESTVAAKVSGSSSFSQQFLSQINANIYTRLFTTPTCCEVKVSEGFLLLQPILTFL